MSLDQSLILALEDESRWAIKRGLVREMNIPNYLDFIYLDGLTSVKPEAVRILGKGGTMQVKQRLKINAVVSVITALASFFSCFPWPSIASTRQTI